MELVQFAEARKGQRLFNPFVKPNARKPVSVIGGVKGGEEDSIFRWGYASVSDRMAVSVR